MPKLLRSLLKSPVYTLIAVAALALGIGANTVLFSAISTLFLRPLPFADSDRLVRIYSSFAERGLERTNVSWPRFKAWAEQQRSFSHFAAQSFTGFTLTGTGEPERLQAMRVTGDFLPALGVQPVLGRGFTAEEQAPGGANAILVSHGFWQRRLGGSADAIGKTLTLDGKPHTVVGVLPASVGFPWQQFQIWAPRVYEQEGVPPELVERGTGYLLLLGRLKPGVTVAQATEEMKVITSRYGAAFPEKVDAKTGSVVVPWLEDLVGDQRPMFITLLAAVGCVLLVACANVANLLLARFTARRKETAIRVALGASRRQIAVQFLAESVLLSALAGGLGILLASWGLPVLARLGQDFSPRLTEVRLDLAVLGFAVLLSLLTGVVLGIVPALQASRTDANEALKDSSRGSTAGRHRGRFRSILLVAEVAMSLVLLVGAALLIDSFRRLQHVDPGFKPQGLTTFFVGLPAASYPDVNRQSLFYQTLLEKLSALPGVTHASAASSLPIAAGGFSRSPAAVEGRALPPVGERLLTVRSTITPGHFTALGIPLKQGRDFTWRDRDGQVNVVIINETMARQLFPGENPVGRRLITGIASVPREIVGVVGDVRSENLTLTPGAEMYYPAAQIDGAFLSVVVRSERSTASLRPEIVATLHSLDPGLPVGDIDAYPKLLAQAVSDRRLATWLLGGFALLALVLAGMGLYSVIAYGVAQRTNEFGIRMALGAKPSAVIGLVLREGLRLTAIGLLVGLGVAFALTHLMQTLLFEVSATDPLVFAFVAVFLLVVATLACLVPAISATKVDPISALRAE